ncbi:hypothetical protein [Haloferula sargassicola]|uniref:Uncharacterized protein n=1 Tax=Haloferula sargassicola TaxID=490096 RepID=A0ABP9URU9_9BACT
MTPKPIFIHLGWAVAAGAAFFIGSKAGSPSAEEIAAAQAAAGGKATTRGSASFEAGARAAKSGERGDDASREGTLGRLFGGYTLDAAGISAVADQALRSPNPITRRLAFAHLLENMTADNAMEVREALVTLGAGGDEWRDFNYAFGALAGKDAFDFATTSPETDLGAAFSGWASAHPNDAIAMLDNLPPELANQRGQLERDLISGLADHDLQLATDTALRLAGDDPRQAGRLMWEVANEAIRSGGPETASRWVDSLPDGPQKGAAMRRVTDSYVREDPTAAAAWVEQFAGQDFAVSAIAEVGDEWAERAPAEAVDWIESLPAGNAKNAGYAEAFGNWEDRNPEAATQHLAGMSPGPERDAAIAGFSRGYAWNDPQTAIAWAADISDPGMRERSLVRAGQAYLRRDPQEAINWLQDSGLSANAQLEVMRGAGGGRWRR